MSSDDSALYPPNFCRFSDDVICEVAQRARVASSAENAESSSSVMLPPPRPGRLPSLLLVANPQPLAPLAAREDSALSKRKGPLKSAKSPTDKERLRERNRMHQARYKMKQLKLVENLERDCVTLRGEIQELEVQRQVLSANVSTNTTVWSVATEYFRLFRNGVKTSLTAAGLSALCPNEEQRQREFLLQTMTADITDGMSRGVGAFLEGWKRFSFYNGDISITLTDLEIGAGNSLIASTKGTHCINENTLRYAFPHLVNDGDEALWTPLAVKLLGQQLTVRGSVRLGWDEEQKRVMSVEYKADILTPLLSLLGNLEDVSRVFDNAFLTPEGGLVTDQDLSSIF